MSEEQQAVEVEALEDELSVIRAEVQKALDDLVVVYDRAEAEFKPVAHELRVQGVKVKPMCPRWLSRSVHYAKFAERKRYPVK